jgi:enoyl-CoA hydratase/carnithine racemase
MEGLMSDLSVSSADGVAKVVFDRPQVLNALTPALLSELIEGCERIAKDDAIKVVRFEGAGKAFSAGADLPAFLASLNGADARDVADLGRRATNAVAELPQITIAAITGHCVGGGLVLAAACDIRIADDNARFLIPELDAGIPLAWGGMEWVVRLVGETMAADLVLSCRPVDAEEALQAGLISRVVSPDVLQEELETLERQIAAKPRHVLRVTKGQLLQIRGGTFDACSDADALLHALEDPESMQFGMRYVAERIRKSS